MFSIRHLLRRVRSTMRSSSSLILLSAASLLLLPSLTSATLTATPGSVKLQGNDLMVDGQKFRVHGMAYSPVPVGENVNFAPFGDYFTPDYAYLWRRDLQKMLDAGVNTIRIYAWKNAVDHTPFLDTCHQLGLKVMLTHYMGDSAATPVKTAEDRQASIDNFVKHVQSYGDHPAILMWSIGNELNGAWLGFRAQLSDAFQCGWTDDCENNEDGPDSKCFKSQTCMYTQLFTWINSLAAAGKKVTTRPLTSAFADVDRIVGDKPVTDKLARFEPLLKDLDFHTFQIYRGKTFGGYFTSYSKESQKPILVGEFGIDAYNDACGWKENFDTMRPCFNTPLLSGQPIPEGALGGADVHENYIGCTSSDDCKDPGVTTQAKWDSDLARELLSYPQVLGGIVVAWHDENWKGIGTQDKCDTPCPLDKLDQCNDPNSEEHKKYMTGGSAGCTYKAHVTCSNYNMSYHDLCGYYLWSAPDSYVNEQWFGLNSVIDCGVSDKNTGHRLSALTPRPVLNAISTVYGGKGVGLVGETCDQLKPCWQCTRSNTVAQITGGACDDVCSLQFKGKGYNGATDPGDVATGGNSASATSSSLLVLLGSLIFVRVMRQ